jgi:hypothetical protein
LENNAEYVYGEGDGTVPKISMNAPLKWNDKDSGNTQPYPVHLVEFEGDSHNGILTNNVFISEVIKLLQIPECSQRKPEGWLKCAEECVRYNVWLCSEYRKKCVILKKFFWE